MLFLEGLLLVSTLEQFGDLEDMSIEVLIGRLKTHEEGARRYGSGEEEQLLLTQAKWKAKEKEAVEGSFASKSPQGCGKPA